MKNMDFFRPTWVEVDLAALRHNFVTLKKKLPPSIKMMVAVKANAYGHGLVPVSRQLVASGADYLGVACVDEGLILRDNGIKTPILNLGAFFKSDIEVLIRRDITATVTDLGLGKR